jgi:hypothetical protein
MFSQLSYIPVKWIIWLFNVFDKNMDGLGSKEIKK